MTIIDYVKKLGKFDAARLQYTYAFVCVMLFLIITLVIFAQPLYRYDSLQYALMNHFMNKAAMHHAIVSRKETIESRYESILAEMKAVAECSWVKGKTTDTLDVNYEQSRACLDAWVINNPHEISEITFYRHGKTRTLEIVHD